MRRFLKSVTHRVMLRDSVVAIQSTSGASPWKASISFADWSCTVTPSAKNGVNTAAPHTSPRIAQSEKSTLGLRFWGASCHQAGRSVGSRTDLR